MMFKVITIAAIVCGPYVPESLQCISLPPNSGVGSQDFCIENTTTEQRAILIDYATGVVAITADLAICPPLREGPEWP